MRGYVKKICADRGFGFIHHADGDIFCHVTALSPDLVFDERLEGMEVSFDIGTDPRSGRERAQNVRAAR